MKLVLGYLVLLAYDVIYISCITVESENETLRADVKVGKKTFQCAFTLFFSGTTFLKNKSKLSCTPKPTKKVKMNKFTLKGQLGTYTLTGTINPDVIKKAIFEPAVLIQVPVPRDDFYGSSCPLGHSWICTPDEKDPLSCPQGLNSVCPGLNQAIQASAGPSLCTCLPTEMVEQSLAYGRNPLGRCHSGCVCVPPLCTSGIAWVPGKPPVTPSIPIITPQDLPNSILLVCGDYSVSLHTEVIGVNACPVPKPQIHFEYVLTFVTNDNLVISCSKLYNYYNYDYYDSDENEMTVCDVLDVEAQIWRWHSNISQYIQIPSTVNIPAGVFIFGGYDEYAYGEEASDSTWFLPTGSASWKEGPILPRKIGELERHCSVPIGDDAFLIIGGSKRNTYPTEQNSIMEFDFVKNRWDILWGKLNIARMDHACVNLENRKIIVAGGYGDDCGGNMDSTEVIDILTKAVRKVGALPEKRSKLGISIIGSAENIKVLAFGGSQKTIHLWNDTTEGWLDYGIQTINTNCMGAAVRSELICRARN